MLTSSSAMFTRSRIVAVLLVAALLATALPREAYAQGPSDLIQEAKERADRNIVDSLAGTVVFQLGSGIAEGIGSPFLGGASTIAGAASSWRNVFRYKVGEISLAMDIYAGACRRIQNVAVPANGVGGGLKETAASGVSGLSRLDLAQGMLKLMQKGPKLDLSWSLDFSRLSPTALPMWRQLGGLRSLDVPNPAKITSVDWPKFQIPNFRPPRFEMPTFDWNKLRVDRWPGPSLPDLKPPKITSPDFQEPVKMPGYRSFGSSSSQRSSSPTFRGY